MLRAIGWMACSTQQNYSGALKDMFIIMKGAEVLYIRLHQRLYNKTYSLKSAIALPVPLRQPCLPSCRAVGHPTYDWLTNNWRGDNWRTTDSGTTDSGTTDVGTTDKQLTNDWRGHNWCGNNRKNKWWTTGLSTTDARATDKQLTWAVYPYVVTHVTH